MSEKDTHIHNEVIDAIIDKPIPFTIGEGRLYYLYQPSLGVSLLAGQLLQDLQFKQDMLLIDKQAEILRVCIDQRDIVLRIISLHTFSRRSDVLQENKLQARIKELEALQASDIATLIVAILAWDGRQEKFIKFFGLDKERRTRERIYSYKKQKGGSMTFGGHSVYGSLLDAACERYGWELGYVLWGISSINLNMLLADSVQSVYLTKEEAGNAHISTDGVYIDARNPQNLQEIQRLIKGK